MKHKNKKGNKLIAWVMCAVMLGLVISYMPGICASATESQTYGEWKEMKPVNGSFEVGYEGMEVYGWSKTAMESNNKKTINTESDPKRVDAFLNSFTLKTAVEDGNKVAALAKTGAGYAAATSRKILVLGLENYRISFDYKTVKYALKDETKSGDDYANANVYYGARLLVEELDKDGNTVLVGSSELKEYFRDDTNNAEWSTGIAEFQTQEATESVVIYLWMGAGYNRNATVYFDNVTLEKVAIANADFEYGMANESLWGWTKTAIDYGNGGGKITNESTATVYCNNHDLTIAVDEDGNKVAELYHKGAGYAAATSSAIQVSGETTYQVSFKYKTGIFTGSSDSATRTAYLGMRLYIEEQDADGNTLSFTRSYSDTAETDGWRTCTKEFQTQEDAVSVIIYLWMGGEFQMRGSVYFDDVTWEEVVAVSEEDLKTDLLFVMLQEGNANDAGDTTVDVRDLVRIKKYIVDNTQDILDSADMNNNGVINDVDLLLLKWKLLGVTTTEQAQSVH